MASKHAVPVSSFEKFTSPQPVPLFSQFPLYRFYGRVYLSHNYNLNLNHSATKPLSPIWALKEEKVDRSTNSETRGPSNSPSTKTTKMVLVVGGTGGVGQLVVASLLRRKIKLRLILRDPEKAKALFGEQNDEFFQVWRADTRNPGDFNPSIFEGVSHVICCTGTTAFPSRRWDGDNTPERVDWEGVRNLVSTLPQTLKRIVLVSSVGVTKFNELPWSIMNLFGVLKYKKMGEDFVRNSGLPYTIIRPGRLTDGPYTSYDLNTLFRATAAERQAVLIGQGDNLTGQVSRLVVAEACIQALDMDITEREVFEVNSIKGDGPGSDPDKWRELFEAARTETCTPESAATTFGIQETVTVMEAAAGGERNAKQSCYSTACRVKEQ